MIGAWVRECIARALRRGSPKRVVRAKATQAIAPLGPPFSWRTRSYMKAQELVARGWKYHWTPELADEVAVLEGDLGGERAVLWWDVKRGLGSVYFWPGEDLLRAFTLDINTVFKPFGEDDHGKGKSRSEEVSGS